MSVGQDIISLGNLASGTAILANLKKKGSCSQWPAMVCDRPSHLNRIKSLSKPGHYCVYYFGSHTYGPLKYDKAQLFNVEADCLPVGKVTTAHLMKAYNEIWALVVENGSIFLDQGKVFQWLDEQEVAKPKAPTKKEMLVTRILRRASKISHHFGLRFTHKNCKILARFFAGQSVRSLSRSRTFDYQKSYHLCLLMDSADKLMNRILPKKTPSTKPLKLALKKRS